VRTSFGKVVGDKAQVVGIVTIDVLMPEVKINSSTDPQLQLVWDIGNMLAAVRPLPGVNGMR
jgi:hypothetical protein